MILLYKRVYGPVINKNYKEGTYWSYYKERGYDPIIKKEVMILL